MDLLDLIRINKTVQNSNRTLNRPDDTGLTKTVIDTAKKVFEAVPAAIKTTYNTVTAPIRSTVLAVQDPKIKDLTKKVIDAVLPESLEKSGKAVASNVNQLLLKLFGGDLSDVSKYEAYAASLPAFSGELSASEMIELRTALQKMFPGVYTGADVNDAAQIESEIIRPIAMILSRQFGIPVMMLSSMLKMIVYYETSASGKVARTIMANKPVGLFQYIPSVLKKMEASLGKFQPGSVKSEVTFGVNYFGDILKTVTNRFKVDANSDVPMPKIFKEDEKNIALRAKLAVLPFSKNQSLNKVLLMMAIHRCGYNPSGTGYNTSNLNEVVNKRVPSFIQSFVTTKSNKAQMYT